jgi:hypothetical protein
LSRERLRIGLGSSWLTVAGYRRSLRSKPIRREVIPVEPTPATAPWQAAVDALPAALARAGKAEVTVVLSNHFVRYALLPWTAHIRARDEWLALARHRLTAAHGALVDDWSIRVSETAARGPRIASAVDKALLGAVTQKVAASGAILVSVQPYLMAAFNRIRHLIGGESCWLVVEEPGRLTLSLIERGIWSAIRTRRKDEGWRDALPEILERESALLALAEPCTQAVIHTHVPFESSTLGALRLRDVTLAAGATPADRQLAMALG